ncbi:MAG TPA: PDZ domain-containing protein [Gemmatimonadales bacterium]|jgi:predicted metalloprotease with PDZ domain|nr:PDZ domain-containing protein [Gemmatimonadales bacterium]
MRHVLPFLLLISPCAGVAAQTPLQTYADAFIQQSRRTDPKVDYTVTVRDRDRSAYFVELRIANAPNPARLVIPNWAPGAYRLMDSGQNIAGVAAFDAAGNALPITRDSDISWTVDTKGAATVVVRYSAALRDPVQWTRPNNRWFLRQTSGIVDGPRTFMYLDGWKLTPTHVTFRLPTGWRIGTGLVPTTDSTTYWAPSYDVLIDSPVLVGRFLSYQFTAGGGVPHRAVVDLGGATARAARTFVDMVRRISETTIGIFGSAPYKDYTYIFVGGRGGGLEHLNSTTIGVSADVLARNPLGAEGVTAHEFFHTWNVKRIRPAELGPFDYEGPVRTVNLWVSEGITDYYTEVILARSGLNSAGDFARRMGDAIGNHRGNAARLVVSPERASWTVWDSPAVNDSYTISYYLQGQLLGFLLDLAIRDSTDNAKSLDDVMRYLFDHHAGERGFTSADLVAAIRTVTGLDFQDFWRKYVSGTAEIPWDDYLQAAGWSVTFSEEPAADARIGAITPAVQGGRWRAVATPGSAAAQAGLRTGDELVRVNGRQIVDGGDIPPAVRGVPTGAVVTVQVVRDGAPLTIRFAAGTYQRTRAVLRDLPDQTERTRRVRVGILTGR